MTYNKTMPYDAYNLLVISKELENMIIGFKIDRILCPSPESCVLELRRGRQAYWLVCNTAGGSGSIYLSDKKTEGGTLSSFCQALKKRLSGGIITAIWQPPFERLIQLQIQCRDALGYNFDAFFVAEIMGRYSNIFLLDDNKKIVACQKHFALDLNAKRPQIVGSTYLPPPAQDKLDILQHNEVSRLLEAFKGGNIAEFLLKHIKGFSLLTLNEQIFQIFGQTEAQFLSTKNIKKIADGLIDFYENCMSLCRPCLIYENDAPIDFCALDISYYECQKQAAPSLNAAADFVLSYSIEQLAITNTKRKLSSAIKKALGKAQKKLGTLLTKIKQAEDCDKHKLYGDLLTVNLYQIKQGQSSAALTNYNDGQEIIVPLDQKLSPQANAQLWYKKYTKAKRTLLLATQMADQAKADADYFEELLSMVEMAASLAELDSLKEELEFLQLLPKAQAQGKVKKAVSMPYAEQYDGFMILAGKNNVQNDKITKEAKGNEYWFHAKDYTGSHIIIKGNNPPQHIILRAAALAAFFSKAKNLDLAEVDCVQIKYVKKPANAPPGKVVYSNQKTIRIKPAPPAKA